jgi:hypothetical protein
VPAGNSIARVALQEERADGADKARPMRLAYGPAKFHASLAGLLAPCERLQDASQVFARHFYEQFAESTVLLRVFATLRGSQLGAADLAFAREFAPATETGPELGAATDVLTLLGTFGARENWRAREASQGHRAIPLLSDASIGEIPMIARLLGELGFPSLQRRNSTWQFVKRRGREDGLFFVGDARSATDERGRRIIPALDFVERYGVKTVFGFGGPYPGTQVFLATIVFSRDVLLRSDAERYVALVEIFRANTASLVDAGDFFAPE